MLRPACLLLVLALVAREDEHKASSHHKGTKRQHGVGQKHSTSVAYNEADTLSLDGCHHAAEMLLSRDHMSCQSTLSRAWTNGNADDVSSA